MSIPKIIIQTDKSPEQNQQYRETWQQCHPDYDYRFYDDQACIDFISKHYPSFVKYYQALPLKVQQADYFRYLSIYHYGGIYADTDTECKFSIDTYIDREKSNLVVGTEMTPLTFSGNLESYNSRFCYPRQFLQWTFAAPPKHHILAIIMKSINFQIDSFKNNLITFSNNDNFTMELTGPFQFSKAIESSLIRETAPNVTILPQVSWGYSPWVMPNIETHSDDNIKVVHLFQGSWKTE